MAGVTFTSPVWYEADFFFGALNEYAPTMIVVVSIFALCLARLVWAAVSLGKDMKFPERLQLIHSPRFATLVFLGRLLGLR